MSALDERQLRHRVTQWLAIDPDETTRAELRDLLDADELTALHGLFSPRLQFGTAGMRGIRGAGPARMNRLLVRLLTLATAQVLLRNVRDAAIRGVVIGYDARHLSETLAHDTCGVLTAAGIAVRFIDTAAPTPLVPFAVRHHAAAAGIVLTASHNPPQYNGYKLYWEDGAPIVPPIDASISAALDALDLDQPLACLSIEQAGSRGLLTTLATVTREADAPSLADAYLQATLPPSPAAGPPVPGIVYTPLHGVAGDLALRALARNGFDRLSVVAEQFEPDGNFPTLDYPNPEEPRVLQMALDQARAEHADLVLANDPDGDRLAVIVRHADDYRMLGGDQIGWLLADFLLDRRHFPLPDRAFVITTLVSSVLLQRIAALHGVDSEETLTGLKWVWQRALERERGGGHFVFGYEESIGYSVCPAVRDKDGISAAVLFASLVRAEAADGHTVIDRLERIHRRAGYAQVRTLNIAFGDHTDRTRAERTMDALRTSPPHDLGDEPVSAIRDIFSGVRRDLVSGARTSLALPASNVLQLELAGGSRVSLRPSGTEPKFKIYIDVYVAPELIDDFARTQQQTANRLDRLETAIRNLFSVA